MRAQAHRRKRSLVGLMIDALSYLLVTRIRRRADRTGLFRGPLVVPLSDLLGQRVIATGSFETRQFDAIDAMLADPKAFLGLDCDWAGSLVDVGANIGLYPVRYAAAFQATLAIEANPDTAKILEVNISLNRSPNVTIRQAAVSDQAGHATLHVATAGMLGWSRLGTGVSWQTTEVEVETCTLDGIVDAWPHTGRVALLKIDVEGHEPQVLRGASATLRKHGPVVLFEALDASAATTCTSMLTKAGYHDFFTFERRITLGSLFNGSAVEARRVNPLTCGPGALICAVRSPHASITGNG